MEQLNLGPPTLSLDGVPEDMLKAVIEFIQYRAGCNRPLTQSALWRAISYAQHFAHENSYHPAIVLQRVIDRGDLRVPLVPEPGEPPAIY